MKHERTKPTGAPSSEPFLVAPELQPYLMLNFDFKQHELVVFLFLDAGAGAGASGLGLGSHLRHWGFHSTLKRFRRVLYTEEKGRRELLRQWVSVPRKRGEPLQWWNVKRYARRGIMPHITLEEKSGLPSYKDKKDSVNRTLHSQYRGSITGTSISILIHVYVHIQLRNSMLKKAQTLPYNSPSLYPAYKVHSTVQPEYATALTTDE
ncbi:hypothetical protein KQX54_018495 [Cotesia glomerata]|uniref:Uncharacterized protein n=1 Tax=Cotesia glomerata TaxID=32391 RepID=A0AAV7I062_COTGL|nr:hypothetical protein KQX54_018495 [Cotesia glomerata]